MQFNDPKVIQGLMGAVAVLLIVVIYLLVKLNSMSSKYAILMKGSENKSLEEMFIKRLETIDSTTNDLASLDARHNELRKQVQGCVQRVGMVRFNAYGDISGDLSYAVALLDEKGDGVVLSGMTSRHDARPYAKPIESSVSKYTLIDEEKQAISIANRKHQKN